MDGHSALKHHLKHSRLKKGIPFVDTWLTRVIDVVIYPIGFASLLMTLPQVYEIWILGNVAGVSLVTWASWTVFSLFWVVYGVAHKAKALILIHFGWFLMNGLVAVGLLVNQ